MKRSDDLGSYLNKMGGMNNNFEGATINGGFNKEVNNYNEADLDAKVPPPAAPEAQVSDPDAKVAGPAAPETEISDPDAKVPPSGLPGPDLNAAAAAEVAAAKAEKEARDAAEAAEQR